MDRVDLPYLLYVASFDALVSSHQLLVQLFSRTKASEHNRDLVMWNKSRQLDQVTRHVEYPDLIAHIQNKNFSAFCAGGGLKNQLHRFGNGHEVPGYFRVGHG